MDRHETRLQYTKVMLLAAILLFALWNAGTRPPSVQAQGGSGAIGQPIPAFGLMMAGSDGTNLRALSTDATGGLITSLTDPCQSSGQAKSSIAINLTTATTTQIVAPSGSTVIYVCGASFTIAPSATTADTLQFTTGTGGTCGTGTVTQTGTFGNGDLTTAAPPLFVTFADPGTTFKSAAGAGLCAVSAGTTVNIQGIVTYIQK